MSNDKPFDFIRMNPRTSKPRKKGLTEIRGPYYTVMGKHYLTDLLEMMGDSVDSLKFACGSFSVISPQSVKELIDIAHRFNVKVSTGGFIEYALTQGNQTVDRYIETCKNVGFDIIELSSGFISIGADDICRLIEKVKKSGLLAKPEVSLQFGAGGTSTCEQLEKAGMRPVEWVVKQAKQYIDAGAYMIMIESEGLTESVTEWRTDLVAKIIDGLGLEKTMFEAADPQVFTWYLKNYGTDINLFIDHSQIINLEVLRRGIWGTNEVWGRLVSY
jgi:phosphosulfolactate synthase (CoM biosynthesis protein A)